MYTENVIKKIFFIFITFLPFSLVSMEEEKTWIFLRKIDLVDLPDRETMSWRILNRQLEFNTNSEDIISTDIFAHLLKEAQKKDIPYILIGLRDKNSFYHFLDGSYLPILANKWENPFTRQPPHAIEIFVAGNDEKLIFLDEFDLETIKNNFLTLQDAKWHLKKDLQKFGYGHVLIANLFIQKAESINQFHYEINQEKLQEIHQYTFQWLNWALKNLPPGEEHFQAQQEHDRIFKILKPTLIINTIVKEAWKIKKQIQHSTHIKNATYNEPSKKISILDNKNVTLSNIDDEKQQVTLPHISGLWKPSFDPCGRYIVTNPKEKTIILSHTNGEKITTIIPENYPQVISFNNQANQILIAGENNIQLRNLDNTLITNCNLKSEYWIKIAKFFPNNDNLIFLAPFEIYGITSKAKVWDVRNKNVITYDYIGPLNQASIHPEGSYLACTKQQIDGVAHMYDLRKKGNIHLSNFSKPRSAKFNSRGTHILTQYHQAYLALLWKTQSIITEKYLNLNTKFNPDNLCGATFHPYENNILTYSTKNNLNHENNFSIWDFDGNQLAKLPHEKTIYSAKYDSTGNYIISRHDDNIERNIASTIVTLWEKERRKI